MGSSTCPTEECHDHAHVPGHDPETAIRREASEELGVEVGALTHVFDAYMSPGSVTERVHFSAAEYSPAGRTSAGGGAADEGEEIEVLELSFVEALAMVDDGRIVDGKTIMLLQWAALRRLTTGDLRQPG